MVPGARPIRRLAIARGRGASDGVLRGHRFTEPGYPVVLDVGRSAVVRAEPFELVEAELFDEAD